MQTMLLVTTYPADALADCGGTILKYVQEGHNVHLIVMSDGLTQTSTFVPEELVQNQEAHIQIRRSEFSSIYQSMGVSSVEYLGLRDCPLTITTAHYEQLAVRIRSLRPDFIVTHAIEKDLDRLESTAVAQAVTIARNIATAIGAICDDLPAIPHPIPVFGMEPFRAENCGWVPGIMLDITQFEDKKEMLMDQLTTQQLPKNFLQQRARARGVHSSGRGGKTGCKYAEAFSFYAPIYTQQNFVW